MPVHAHKQIVLYLMYRVAHDMMLPSISYVGYRYINEQYKLPITLEDRSPHSVLTSLAVLSVKSV